MIIIFNLQLAYITVNENKERLKSIIAISCAFFIGRHSVIPLFNQFHFPNMAKKVSASRISFSRVLVLFIMGNPMAENISIDRMEQ